MLRNRPITMLIVAYSALSESRVVKEPAPAIRGKAIGTIEAPVGESCLNMVTPRIISMAIMNNTNEPAMAKDEISTPKRPKRAFPIKRKVIRIIKDTKEA